MNPAKTAEEAYAVCEAIAGARTLATGRSAYGDGYRAAAEHIAAEIRANRVGTEARALERDLRDAEVEARTMARVLETANDLVERSGARSDVADAIRTFIGVFFAQHDLPPVLRACERASATQLVGGASRPSLRAGAGRAGAHSAVR